MAHLIRIFYDFSYDFNATCPQIVKPCHPEAQQGTCFLRCERAAIREDNRNRSVFRQGTASAAPNAAEHKRL
jgi:hypothetical protein